MIRKPHVSEVAAAVGLVGAGLAVASYHHMQHKPGIKPEILNSIPQIDVARQVNRAAGFIAVLGLLLPLGSALNEYPSELIPTRQNLGDYLESKRYAVIRTVGHLSDAGLVGLVSHNRHLGTPAYYKPLGTLLIAASQPDDYPLLSIGLEQVLQRPEYADLAATFRPRLAEVVEG